MDLNNKTAILTGGASGLGEATARLYAELGVNVAIFDMADDRGNAVVAELGEQALYCSVNVVDEDSVAAGIEAAKSAFGPIHILNNFAGINRGYKVVGKEFVPHALDKYREVIDINLIGTFNVLRLVAAEMAQQEPVTEDGSRGVIINTGSIAGYEGQIGQAAYAASKGGVIGMTICLARDLAEHGIRVNAIVPGLVHTPLFDALPEHIFEALESSVLYPKRLGRPAEIAHLARTIAENDYINGECIRIDGGIRMQAR